MKIFRTLLFSFLLLSGLCLQSQTISKNITTHQADSLIKARSREKTLIILDVRTPMELEKGKLENSMNINYLSLWNRRKIWKLDRNKAYLIYCTSGVRSATVLKKMERRNFHEVYNMLGGIRAWKERGLPVSAKKNKIKD